MDENSASFDEQLLTAYRLTHYWVDKPRLFLRIDARHPELDDYLFQNNTLSWAYLTAYNPQSKMLSLSENKKRHQKLCEQLDQSGFSYSTGRTEALRADWPPEESLIIWDITKAAALQIAQEYNQYAFLFGTAGSPAQLVYTNIQQPNTPP